MRKKAFLVFAIFLFFLNSFSQMRAVFKDNATADNEIYKISLYSPSQGYVAFRDWIGFTTDSGHTFTRKPITMGNVDYSGNSVNLTFGFGINGVKAFSQDTLLAYGDYGLVPAILYSTNGGNTFKLIYHSQYDPMQLRTGITSMVFPQGGNIGFAVDADRILKTTNRGLTWTAVRNDPGSYFDHLEAVDNNTVFAFSTAYNTSKLLKTTSGGTSWQQLSVPSGQYAGYAHFLTASKGWLNTWKDEGRTYYTANGGSSWTLMNNPEVTPFRTEKMRFVNDSTGYALGGPFTLYKTTDSGKVWQRLPRDNNFTHLGYSHNDLFLWNNAQLWAGGGHGFLEISTNGGGSPIPSAYFRIDTAGVQQTGSVNLVNLSKPGYQYQWFVNGVQAGTGYHAAYTRDPFRLGDTVQLIVSNGTYADTAVKQQYFHPPVIVSSFSPTSGARGTIVTIKGRNFTGATSVSFGGTAASFTLLSDTAIRATVGNGASGSVRVNRPTGSGSLGGFTFIPPPDITSFAPATGEAGTTVTITGQNLVGVTGVLFGGVAAASYTVVSPTTITAVVGVGASGSVTVKILGDSAVKNGFVIIPKITSFTPASGTFGTYMTITGTGFGGTTAVTVGGAAVASFTVNSHTQITAVLAAGANGDVKVTAPGGTSVAAGFGYFEPPVITSVSPQAAAPGATVTVTGSNFNSMAADNTVYFGAVKATVVSASATSLTVMVPYGATYAPVRVTANYLTAHSQIPFMPVFANGGAISTTSFATQANLSLATGEYLEDAAIGDIDGDGKPDVVVAKQQSYVNQTAVAVYRNIGTGSSIAFAPKVEFATPYPGSVALSDLDGDGKLDIAVTNDDEYVLYLFRNTSAPGSISMAPRFDLATSRMNQKIIIEDMDADGKPDVVFSTWWEGKLVVHRNVSNPGVLAFGPKMEITGAAQRNLVLRDLDGDARPELIDANRIFKNTSTRGSISFAAAFNYPGYTHSHVSVGDIDGDGKQDVITSDPYGSKVAVYRNTTTAGLDFAPVVLVDAVTGPGGLALSDFDGDGKLDVATTLTNTRMGVLKNLSTPGTVTFAPKVGYLTGTYYQDHTLVAGDLNGDGRPEILVDDILFVNAVKPEPMVMEFSPTIGTAGTTVTITGANFNGVTAVSFGGVAAASFTVNSATSITAVVGSGASGEVAVTTAIGTGKRPGFVHGFPPSITSFSPEAAVQGSTVTITGTRFSPTAANNIVFFGSEKAAVTSVSATSLTVTVPKGATHSTISVTVGNLTAYSNKPFTTTFAGSGPAFTASSFGDTARFADRGGLGAIFDVDGDGKLDYVATAQGNTVRISPNTSTTAKFSLGTYTSLSLSNTPANIGYGDVDGDGKQDLVITNENVAFVSVFLNNSTPGNFSFSVRTDLSTGLQASGYGPVLRDLDLDGKPEIVVAGYSAQTVSVLPNLSRPGLVSFGSRSDFTVDGYPTDVKVEDVDGDGLAELLVTVNGPGEVSVFRNISTPGAVAFALKQDFPVGSWPQSLCVGDLDGDGRKEAVVANLNGNSVSVLKNTSTSGNVSFSKTDLTGINRPWTVWINDMDGDGKADLAVHHETPVSWNTYDRSVAIHKNTNTSAGVLSLAAGVDYPVGEYAVRSISGDMNGDGRPEIMVFNAFFSSGNGNLLILKNKTGDAQTFPVCAGTTASIGSDKKGGSYQWQENTGAGFVNLANSATVNGVTTDTLRLQNMSASRQGYQYRCLVGADTSIVSALSINPQPVANAGADTVICAGTAATIGVPWISGYTYSWLPAPGLNFTTGNMPTVYPTTATTYVLTVTNMYGCTATDSVQVGVTQVPTPVITANGPSVFCAGESVTLTSSSPIGNRWYKDGNTSAYDTSRTYTARLAGRYTVRVTNGGCLSAPSQGVWVSLNYPPFAPTISANGPTTFCQGNSVTLSSADTGSHQWYRNGVAIAGATAANHTVVQGGSYTATKTGYSCPSTPSTPITITVTNSITTPAISYTGATVFCQGDSLTLNSSAAAGNQWYRNDAVIAGATRASLSVNASGSYSVRATVGNCNSDRPAPVIITANAAPAAPVITLNGNVLTSSAPAGNQWYLNGAAITGATGTTHTPAAMGNYSAKTVLNGCVSAFSNEVSFAGNGRVMAGPNPATTQLTLSYPGNTDPLIATLSDLNGHRIFQSGSFTTTLTIGMQGLQPGTYVVEIINQKTGERQRMKVLKL